MISCENTEKNLRDHVAKLESISKSPVLYINDHFKEIINQIDVHVETILSELGTSEKQAELINKNRETIIERLLKIEQKCVKKFDKKKFLIETLPLINGYLGVNLNKIQTDCLIQDLTELNRSFFDDKWIFFKANKKQKENKKDFGRLIIIDGILNQDLIFDFK